MKFRIVVGIILLAILSSNMNANIGYGSASALSEAECRACHNIGVANTHHILVLIGKYTCVDCHPALPGGFGGILIERDCIDCHNGTPFYANTKINPGAPIHMPVGPPGNITGTEFNDSNGNGTQDPGENGIQNAIIRLSPSETTATTDSNGNYTFTNVPVGHQIVFESSLLPGYISTTPIFVVATVNSGQTSVANFGNRKLISPPSDVSILQQSGSQGGIPTVSRPALATGLTIQKDLSSFNVVAANLTLKWSLGDTKKASMTQITTGIWQVTFNPPFQSGLAQMTFDVDVFPGGSGPEDITQIGDIIFLDPSGKIRNTCNNGPIEGAEVTLYMELHTGNFSISPTGLTPFPNQLPDINPQTTLADGYYGWRTIPGIFKVKVQKTGFNSNESNAVTIPPIRTNLDVLLTPIGGCISISGKKFNDLNGNGVRDSGEPIIAGWAINLKNSNGNAINLTNTDINGNYTFPNLVPGTYIVDEGMTGGWITTKPLSGNYTMTIGGVDKIVDKDFGNFRLGSVFGKKFNDLNGNGLLDSEEAGLQGWQISLNGTDTITNIPVNLTTVTDANGNYNFTGLTNGTYTISEIPKEGWVQTAPLTGTYTIGITSGANLTGKDFGNFHKGKITGEGWITITGDPKATFDIEGQYPDDKSSAKGDIEYQDHKVNLNIKSIRINIVATTLDKKKGIITGLATVNGAGSYPFEVYVEDNGGKGADIFKISLPTYPYSNGAVLSGGNIQIYE